VSAAVRTSEKSTPPHPPALRGEYLAGAVLTRSGPLAAGLVASTALLAAILVPFGGWRPWIVVPLLLVITVALVRVVRLLPAPPAARWSAPLCLAIAVGHGWWAAATHAQHVVLRRDAGSYALFTQWIATRHGLPVPSYLDAFGGSAALTDPAFRLASPAFFQVVHGSPGAAGTTVDMVPQFLLGAPAVYSLGWWADGWQGLLLSPAIVSALALLAVAGLATRLAGSQWAVPVVAALALAQPVLHTARSTYSEPLALLLVMAAAALLVDAVKAGNGRPWEAGTRPPAWWIGLAAGLGFGLAGLVRVDSIREVAFLLPVAAVLALRGHPAARPLVLGGLGGTLIAAIPAVLLSRPYLGEIAASLLPLLVGGVLLGVLSLVMVRVGRRRAAASLSATGAALSGAALSGAVDGTPATPSPAAAGTTEPGAATPVAPGAPVKGRPEPGSGIWPRRWPRLVAGAVLLVGAILASRPLWMITRQDPNDPGSRVVAGLQLRQGLAVDGGRTYAEHSLAWVSWYVGPVVVLAGWLMLAGLSGAATRWWLLSRRSIRASAAERPGWAVPQVPVWLGPAVIGLAGTVLTLYRPGITPDHPWADRRLVPLVLPTLVIAAGAAAAWVSRIARRRWSAPLLLAVLAVAVVSMLLPPWLATAPVAGDRTELGELAAVDQICGQLTPGDAVLAVDNRTSNEWPQVVRGVCDRPAASIKVVDPSAGAAAVRRIADRIAAAGHRPVLIAGTPEGALLLRELALDPVMVVDLTTTEDQRFLTRVPDGMAELKVQVWLAHWPVPANR
jgi:hypothetical protein